MSTKIVYVDYITKVPIVQITAGDLAKIEYLLMDYITYEEITYAVEQRHHNMDTHSYTVLCRELKNEQL